MVADVLELAKLGYNIFPIHTLRDGACTCDVAGCGSPGKHPRTAHGLKDATNDPYRIEGWWGGPWRDSNVGIATGLTYVVDLDGPEGLDEWAKLEAQHGVALTAAVRTGGGGLHLYYAAPLHLKLPNTASRLGPHIDTRGHGGYVLAPPSLHASGNRYQWVGGVITKLPGWIASLLERRQHTPAGDPSGLSSGAGTAYGRAIRAAALERIRSAPEGARNDTLAREAFVLGQWTGGGEIAHVGLVEDIVDSCPDPDRRKTHTTALRQLREGMHYPRMRPDMAS